MPRATEQLALRETSQRLAELLAQPVEQVSVEPDSDGAFRAGRLLFVVEYKSSGAAASVAAAVGRLREYASKSDLLAIPIVVVPYMGDVGRELCEKARIGWLDLSGNADITAPGLRIHVDGQPNRFKRRGRPSNVFAPKSSRVTRLLLLEPERAFMQRELALETGLGEGFVSRIVRRLEEDELIERDEDNKVRAKDPSLLLDAWAEAYDFSKHRIVRGHRSARTGDALLHRLAEGLESSGLRYAATGLAAAWLHAEFAGFRLTTFYVEQPPTEKLLKDLGVREEARGANVWLVTPNDEGVFHGKEAFDGIPCVTAVQTCLDLQAHPERAPEAAEHLRGLLFEGDGDA